MKRESSTAKSDALFCEQGDLLTLVRTCLGTIYLLARSISLTVFPKSRKQVILTVGIGLQLPEILCKNISTNFLDVGAEQGVG